MARFRSLLTQIIDTVALESEQASDMFSGKWRYFKFCTTLAWSHTCHDIRTILEHEFGMP